MRNPPSSGLLTVDRLRLHAEQQCHVHLRRAESLIQVSWSDGGTIDYTWDAAGNLVSIAIKGSEKNGFCRGPGRQENHSRHVCILLCELCAWREILFFF